jgi:GTP1/Obg family GTP-binding protein
MNDYNGIGIDPSIIMSMCNDAQRVRSCNSLQSDRFKKFYHGKPYYEQMMSYHSSCVDLISDKKKSNRSNTNTNTNTNATPLSYTEQINQLRLEVEQLFSGGTLNLRQKMIVQVVSDTIIDILRERNGEHVDNPHTC